MKKIEFDEMIKKYQELIKIVKPDFVRIEDEENLVFEFKLKESK